MKSCNQRGTCTSHFIRCKMRLTVDYPFPRNPFRFVFPLLFFLSSFLFSFLSYSTNQSLFIFAACNIPKYSTIRVKHSYLFASSTFNKCQLSYTYLHSSNVSLLSKKRILFFNSRRLLKIWKIIAILKVSKCAISILIQFGGERNKGVKKKRDREYFNLKADASRLFLSALETPLVSGRARFIACTGIREKCRNVS